MNQFLATGSTGEEGVQQSVEDLWLLDEGTVSSIGDHLFAKAAAVRRILRQDGARLRDHRLWRKDGFAG